MAVAHIPEDGRRMRREQNRATVLEALARLHAEGVYAPSIGQVAARSGLSPRSLFRYFDDIDDLTRAAIDEQLRKARPLLHIDASPADPLATRIGRLVESRQRLFAATAPAARAARVSAHRHPLIAAQVEESRTFLRSQIERLFAPELSTMSRAGARAALASVDAMCSFETYELLCSSQGATARRAATVLTAAVTSLVAMP